MLQLLLIIPIIGSLLTILVPETTIENKTKIKNIAITTSMINFLISIFYRRSRSRIVKKYSSSTRRIQRMRTYLYLYICLYYFYKIIFIL